MDHKTFIELSIKQGVKLNIEQVFKEAFSKLGKSIAMYAGFSVVSFFLLMAALVFSLFIPMVGGLGVSVMLVPPLTIGIAIFARQFELNQHPNFETFFEGFKTNYKHLILANLIIQLILMVLSSVILLPLLADVYTMLEDADALQDPEYLQEIVEEFQLVMLNKWWLFALYALLSLVVQILVSMTNYFVVFYGFTFVEALESSRKLMGRVFAQALVVNIILGVIIGVGAVFTLGVGMIVLYPLAVLVNYAIFHQIAGFAAPEPDLADELHDVEV